MQVLITGISGYLGGALARSLLARGHAVCGLVRPGRRSGFNSAARLVEGDALHSDDIRRAASSCDTIVHLVGTRRPAPWKQRQFESVDGVSLRATASAAASLGKPHVVYVSVAHPAPAMRGYIAVRISCEALLARLNIRRTVLRPWYVLGPGHRWPVILKPLYTLAEIVPSARATALRLGLLTYFEMTEALVWAVEHPPQDARVLEVPDIRAVAAGLTCSAAEAEPPHDPSVHPV